MKTTNILLRPNMARALREGRKTMTRRIVKLPAKDPLFGCEIAGCEINGLLKDGNWEISPYGQPGDQLRFLTTWAVGEEFDSLKPSLLKHLQGRFWSYHDGDTKPDGFGRLRSGLFIPGFFRDRMPMREIVSIRVERVQDITEEDAIKEGSTFGFWHGSGGDFLEPRDEEDEDASCFRDGFGFLWNSIHGPGAWERNDWVWRIEFKP